MGFGKNLQESLKFHGITVPELSRRTGISSQTIYSLIRRDSNRVNMALLSKIEDAIGDPLYPLSTAPMDFGELIYEQVERYLPRGFALKYSNEELRIQFPDGSLSRETDFAEIQGCIDSAQKFLAFQLEQLREGMA